ncbi:MAG: hypothetical protein OQK35_06430 [Alphaproteobacteria bacterium]|nr:hypothetical protein [Rhodospirillales bacterium]MCW9045954.1 hypothetical protein [Alphaproteobacteria bacterium]
MLFITIFVAISGVSALSLAMIYNLLPFDGRSSDINPFIFLGLGAVVTYLLMLYYRKQTGHWPNFANPDEDKKNMPTNTAGGTHPDKGEDS